jgi:hypothetical protein
MSKIFKTNTRFDALIADVDINNKSKGSNKMEPEMKRDDSRINSFKRDDRPRYEDRDRRNNFYDPKKEAERKLKETQKRKEAEIERQTKEVEEALSDKNFPEFEFTRGSASVKAYNVSSFVYKIKEQMVKNDAEVAEFVEEYIYPGYVVISRDINTNKSIYKFGEQILPLYYEKDSNLVDNIFELYEKRNNKYIELWGEFEYTKVFKFPNYDYEYFDRLDQQYDEELERQIERRREIESLNNISSDEY